MIQSPIQQKKVKLPAPNTQSTPIADKAKKMDQVADQSNVESGLQNLNSRFADIIDRNNQMMIVNQKLRDEVNTVEDGKRSELNQIKKLYETELCEARRLLDLEAQKTVKHQLELSNLRESNKELDEKAMTLKLSEQGARKLAEELQAQLDSLQGEAATMRRKTQDVENQKAALVMQLTAAKSDADQLKKKVDEQAMTIAAGQNQIQSMREEHEMTIRVLKSELEAAKHDQASALQRSMTQENTFNSTMSTAIDEIRAEHEDTLHHREDQIKSGYVKKISDLEGKIGRGQQLLGEKRDEASKHKALHEQAKQNMERLERDLNRAKSRTMNLEADVASQKAMAEDKIGELNASNNEWKGKYEKLDDQMRCGKDQYNSLLKEVETYRSLLEIEENRLNITPSPIQTRKDRKRPRVTSQTTTGTPPKRSKAEKSQGSDLEVADVGANETHNADSSCMIM